MDLSLKVGQLYCLKVEIEVFISNPEVDMLTIFELRTILSKLGGIVDTYNSCKKEIGIKHSNGATHIEQFIGEGDDRKENPDYIAFFNELEPVYNKMGKISFEPLKKVNLARYSLGLLDEEEKPSKRFSYAKQWSKVSPITGVNGFLYIYQLFK